MFKINKEIRLANKIKELLNKRGFIVNVHVSKNSKSVYLKIDNGACNGIRISDHKNLRTKYKYNMIKDYQGKRAEYINGKIITYYNFKSIGRLLADIEIERSNKIIREGYLTYKNIRDNNKTTYYRKAA